MKVSSCVSNDDTSTEDVVLFEGYAITLEKFKHVFTNSTVRHKLPNNPLRSFRIHQSSFTEPEKCFDRLNDRRTKKFSMVSRY